MIEIQHDKTAPEWLGQWMTEAELNSRFSPVMMANAKSFSLRIQKMALAFSPFSLRGTLDRFHPVWHLDKGVWSCRCDCGYPKNECIHAYLAAFLFNQVCKREGWALPRAANPPSKAPSPAQQNTPAPRPAPQRPIVHARPVREQGRPQQLTFFAEEPPAGTDNRPQQPAPPKRCSLRCEADFTSNRFRVVLRFFRVEEGLRYPMLLSAVKLLGMELEKVEAQKIPPSHAWSEKDKAFIQWLHLKLRELDFKQLSMRELYLMPGDFWRWMERWKHEPGRIIEHESQEAVDKLDIGLPVRMAVRLFDHNAFIRVALLVIMEDGKEYHYRILRKMMLDDASGIVKNRFESFNSPVSAVALNRHFGQASADILRGELCRRLPEMLEGHLELLEPSPCLQITSGEAPQLVVTSNFNGYSFYLSVKAGSQPGTQASGVIGKDGICRRLECLHGRFILYQYRLGALQELNQKLHQFLQDTNGNIYNDDYFCRGTADNARKLRDFWQTLPGDIVKRSDAKTRGLLDKASNQASVELSLHTRGRLVEVSASCRCGNSLIPLETLRNAALQNNTILQNNSGEWFDIDPDAFREAYLALTECSLDEDRSLMLPDQARTAMDRLGKTGMLQLEDRSVPFAQRLARTQIPDIPSVHPSIDATLRPYQRIGTQFLLERSRYGVGCILADDMGLGKTLEVLAMLDAWRRAAQGRFRALVVAPASVVPVWCSQCRTFCREMRPVALVGTKEKRRQLLEKEDYDILVTHYGLVRNEIDQLSRQKFDFVILDEAQAIKNPDAQISSAVRALEAGCRIAMTGTPLENSLLDLWSIMDFINPDLMGSRENFAASYADKHGKESVARRLKMLMLRRTKELVAPELPPKTEELLTVEMPDAMRKAYNKELVRARLSAEGTNAMDILASITRLRQFCCAPELLQGVSEKLASPKLELLLEQVTELLGGGHSVVVFSQFTSMLDLIAARFQEDGIPYRMITGEVAVVKREEIIQEFIRDDRPSVFLLSLKAAGTGLTLTKADYVFLFDPWWNPAVENQAIDRTHRIGQDKPVFAYRLVVKDSIEEKVLQIVDAKRQLFTEVIDDADTTGNIPRPTLEELRNLLRN